MDRGTNRQLVTRPERTQTSVSAYRDQDSVLYDPSTENKTMSGVCTQIGTLSTNNDGRRNNK